MLSNKIISICSYSLLFLSCICFFTNKKAYSDVVWTKNGMVINGKVLENTKEKVNLKNYYGQFNIPHKIILKLYITESPEEDQEVFRKLGKKVDKDIIDRNYYSGEKEKNKKAKIYPMTLYAGGIYFKNYGGIGDLLPQGYGGSIGAKYRFGTDKKSEKGGFLTLRFETQYIYLKKDDNKINGEIFLTGPGYNYYFNRYFAFHLDFLGGVGYYNAKNQYVDNKNTKLSGNLSFGFDFMISRFILSPEVRYHYIHDEGSELKGVSAQVAIGVQF